MTKAWGEDPGGIARELTEAERAFLEALGEGPPWLDAWLYRDPDGTPWLIVTLDLLRNGRLYKTLRVDFDGQRILGGDSPAGMNGDDGVRAVPAGIDTAGPEGIALEGHDPEELARAARAWFLRRCEGWIEWTEYWGPDKPIA
jgi:hypothetical protein